MRQLVFGMEDGMVSTLGSITGIAAATQNPFTTVLAGVVIVAVESISMAVGSYLSSKSVRAIDERKLDEEREELKSFPKEEEQELVGMYVHDGWPKPLAQTMASVAAKNKKLCSCSCYTDGYHTLCCLPISNTLLHFFNASRALARGRPSASSTNLWMKMKNS